MMEIWKLSIFTKKIKTIFICFALAKDIVLTVGLFKISLTLT